MVSGLALTLTGTRVLISASPCRVLLMFNQTFAQKRGTFSSDMKTRFCRNGLMSDKFAGDCDITVKIMMVSQEQRVGHASPRVPMLSYQFGWFRLLPHPSEFQC